MTSTETKGELARASAKIMKKKTLTALTGISAAMLTLAACGSDPASSGDGGSDGDTYEWQTNGIAPGEELAIQVPDALRDAAGAEADGLLVKSYELKAHELDGAEFCAIDLAVDYADDATDKLTQPDVTEEEFDEQRGDPEAKVDEMLMGEFGSIEAAKERLGDRYEDYRAEMLASAGGNDEYEPTPPEESLSDRIVDVDGDTYPADDLDPASPEPGAYVSDDYSTITIVQDCAKSPNDPDAAATVEFPVTDDDGFSTFADADVVVMTDGVVSVLGGEVEGWMRDSSDNWIAS